jgi:ArsR family transcriptional regulator
MNNLIKPMKSLADEIRLRMLNLLLQKECCVCEVMQVLEISQTRASRNLNMLYEAGFLKLRKDGLWSYYSVDKYSLDRTLVWLIEAVEEGLKENTAAAKDLANLKSAKRLSEETCR